MKFKRFIPAAALAALLVGCGNPQAKLNAIHQRDIAELSHNHEMWKQRGFECPMTEHECAKHFDKSSLDPNKKKHLSDIFHGKQKDKS